MRKLTFLSVLLALVLLFSNSYAITIDFESETLGSYTSLTIGDVTFTTDASSFSITSASPGPPISGNTFFQYTAAANYASFGVDVFAVSLGVGDFNQDIDNSYMEAYDALDNLLASDFYSNPGSTYGGDYLNVTAATAIAYVKFWDADPFPGAVYWDELTYDFEGSVPEPATLLLLGTGLIGLVGISRRKRII